MHCSMCTRPHHIMAILSSFADLLNLLKFIHLQMVRRLCKCLKYLFSWTSLHYKQLHMVVLEILIIWDMIEYGGC